jgi:hypothetical protein
MSLQLENRSNTEDEALKHFLNGEASLRRSRNFPKELENQLSPVVINRDTGIMNCMFR